VAALLLQLDTSSRGLSPEQAQQRQLRHGPNEVAHEKPLPAWQHLWHCYRNPFNLLLTLLAVVSYVTEDEKATIVIASMVLLSTLLRFVQEGRSRRAAARLQALVSNRVTVRRRPDAAAADFRDSGGGHDTSLSELPMRELVPGDIVALSAGDMIPADCRLLSAKDLFVSQAAMTGESLPVEKDARTLAALQAGQLLEAGNLLFMGTNVVSGSAMAVVVATGNQTYFGTLAARITHQDRTATAFEQGVNSVSWLLIRFAAVMVPVVLFINGYTKGDWGEAFLFALSVAVGLTPEMLPMIVTSTLAKGAVVLSRQKVMVKRLDAIQNFGAMDVLCTDKTGTLTQDRIALERHTDVQGRPSNEVLQFAYLNSYYQTGLKNLLDRAVLEHVELHTRLHVNEDYRKVDEIPFDFQRRRMSVVVAERDHHHELICKGAVEEILQVCTHIRDSGRDGETLLPLTPERREQVRAVTEGLNSEGLRVVAVAMKEVPPDKNTYGIADESGLTLIGYVAFLDPPKESTQAAIAALLQHGVTVKVLTGDNELVARKVCRDVGLQVDEAIVGNDIEAMDEEQLRRTVESHLLFARLTPLHKERIVRALRANGHVTGFMGDGINDAPRCAPPISASASTAAWTSPGSGRHHPAGEKPDGAGAGRTRRTPHLQQHAQVHPHDGQLQLRQRVLGAGGLGLHPLSAHAAHAAADAEPALRPVADRHSLRQRGRGNGRAAAALEPSGPGSLHALLRPHQLAVRRAHLRADVVRLPCQHGRTAKPVPVGLVRGGAADADADRAHDPHAQDSLCAKPCLLALAGRHGGHHGHRHLPAHGPAGRNFKLQALPLGYFPGSSSYCWPMLC
jgi:Mg2+-importing ATPase